MLHMEKPVLFSTVCIISDMFSTLNTSMLDIAFFYLTLSESQLADVRHVF